MLGSPALGVMWRLCLTLAMPCLASQAMAQARLDIDVKARITLGLVRFVQWSGPATAEPVLRLCVWQRAAGVLEAFRTHETLPLNGRRLEVENRAPGAFAGCRVLFVHGSAVAPADALADAVRSGVLTVGDPEGFLSTGGMVELVAVNDAIRFDVHLGTLKAAGLTLSSQALRLARRVRE
ncbi:MAG: YfiR family protein [Rhizobacter sp.]|jgi:hypothetical protein